MPKNAFEILKIEPTKNLNVVKNAYKQQSLIIHPDRSVGASLQKILANEELFKEMLSAYELINEEEKLSDYYLKVANTAIKDAYAARDKEIELRIDIITNAIEEIILRIDGLLNPSARSAKRKNTQRVRIPLKLITNSTSG